MYVKIHLFCQEIIELLTCISRKEPSSKTLTESYSTVTNLSERDEFDSFQYFIEFTVTVSSSNLNNYFYSEHQQYLYETIKELHQRGLGYRKISNWFNERDIKTPRGSDFQGNYVFSILQKGRIREERINRESKWKIHSVKIVFC